MNVFDMANRGDPNLVLRADLIGSAPHLRLLGKLTQSLNLTKTSIAPTKRRVDGHLYRGFDMSGGASFLLRSPFCWHPFRTLPHHTGWEAVLIAGKPGSAAFCLMLIDRESGEPIAIERETLSTQLSSLPLPKPFGWPHDRGRLDLEVVFDASRTSVAFIAVHPVLERKEIIALCRGRGVELGPGPHPQILPADGVDVIYVEQATPEQWESLYNEKGKFNVDHSLWSRYVQGNAYPLPVEDDSIDFIFASHLFEHLANPLGHLEHWRGKLRAGGVIAAVVPDVAGSKDYVFELTPITEILEEHAAGYMEPQLHHFARWASVRAPGKDPQEFMDRNRSIHAHFYTHRNIHELLELAVQRAGFARYDLRYVPNHKDFYFALWK